MRSLAARILVCSLILLAAAPLFSQTQPAPQTARQALIEMFFSKTPGTLEKHLPEATRAAMHKAASNYPMLGGLSMLTSQMQAQGQEFQTFDTGSTLLTFEDHRQNSKFEVTVGRDDLQADRDEIELAFHAYKNGETQTGGVSPALTLTMKPEAGVWRLTDIAITVQLSLTNPDFLKAIATRPSPSTARPIQPVNDGTTTAATASNATASLRILLQAEKAYAARYPAVGYTCSLSDLGGMGAGGDAGEHQAMLINPRLASGKKDGYIFAISGCSGKPVSTFKMTAAPAQPNSGLPTYCSDQSGQIHSSLEGNSACVITGAQ